jgi:hypothetical protein
VNAAEIQADAAKHIRQKKMAKQLTDNELASIANGLDVVPSTLTPAFEGKTKSKTRPRVATGKTTTSINV